ncbi:MAG: hypothetical protein ACD_74C00144G0002 [uncultured bacterium]|nr:MAG: hypothetical protein ACD_74C00144G0002 [uncultured bacterium]
MAVVAVVAHHEQGMGRHRDRAEGVAGLDPARDGLRIKMHGLGIAKRLAIDIDQLVDALHRIPWNSDHPLDKILVRILGKFEDDHLPALRFTDRQPDATGQGVLDPISELVHQDMVADQQGGNHGTRGNLKGLHHKGADKQGKEQGDTDGLRVFAENGFRVDLNRLGVQRKAPPLMMKIVSRIPESTTKHKALLPLKAPPTMRRHGP